MKKKIIIILVLLITLSIVRIKAYKYNATDLAYNNSNLSSSNLQQALEKIYDKICPENNVCYKKKSFSSIEPGDYIMMTPTKTSFTTDTSKTGYSSTQTINPRELNLWRVISKNINGTIDVISDSASSINITFNATNGYANYIGYLNVLANQYQNSTYTIGSRYIGYNEQTEYITDTSKFNGSTTTMGFSTTTSTENILPNYENIGAGDTKYSKDLALVNTALGTLKATKINTNTITKYWVASRRYEAGNNRFSGRYIGIDGVLNNSTFRMWYPNGGWYDYSVSYALRPILTLKSGLSPANAVGSKDDPFILN